MFGRLNHLGRGRIVADRTGGMVELVRRRRAKRTHDQESPAQQQRNHERGSQQRPNPRRAQPVSAYRYVSQAISHMRRAVLRRAGCPAARIAGASRHHQPADGVGRRRRAAVADRRTGGRLQMDAAWRHRGPGPPRPARTRCVARGCAGERIDPDYVARVFGDQINATEAIEYSRFADWKLNPSDAPAARAGPVGVPVGDRRPQPDDADPDRAELGPVCTRRRALRRSTPRAATSSGLASSTASINKPSHWRLGLIALNDFV